MPHFAAHPTREQSYLRSQPTRWLFSFLRVGSPVDRLAHNQKKPRSIRGPATTFGPALEMLPHPRPSEFKRGPISSTGAQT